MLHTKNYSNNWRNKQYAHLHDTSNVPKEKESEIVHRVWAMMVLCVHTGIKRFVEDAIPKKQMRMFFPSFNVMFTWTCESRNCLAMQITKHELLFEATIL